MKFRTGDRVQISLKKSYSKNEIKDGCDPNADGKLATVLGEVCSTSKKKTLYDLRLDRTLEANPLHKGTDWEGQETDFYSEMGENLVKA